MNYNNKPLNHVTDLAFFLLNFVLIEQSFINTKKYGAHGNQVIKFSKASIGFRTLVMTHAGEKNFIVYPIDSKGNIGISLINEIGNYRGATVLPSGTQYLAIEADGNWTLSVK